MKKKNLAILLLLPFVISLLGIITVNLTIRTFKTDITHIEWDYEDIEVFKLGNNRYKLNAVGVNPAGYILDEGNDLVWTVENRNDEEDNHARIEEENGTFYLVPLSEGEVVITCSNRKGNVSRILSGIVYLNSVIVVKTEIQSSQSNIDSTIYYGEYDLKNGNKVPASVQMDVMCVPSEIRDTLRIENATSNISMDLSSETIRFSGTGNASLTLSAGSQEDASYASYTFSCNIVDEGVNVYTYDDLMDCTNRSKTGGDIVVLRTSFESLENTYRMNGKDPVLENGQPVKKANNVALFGNYDLKTKKYSFADDVYYFQTTYNKSFIEQWNAFSAENDAYRPISDQVCVGIRVQKDFYGNGYTINLHNLAFPYDVQDITNEETGEVVALAYLTKDNLFRGPLPFYTLGDPNNMPLVTAYGQDNIGVYVDGDDILINDVQIKNCDFGNTFRNLDYVGTVMEVHGDDVTVQNSILQNGRTVLRVFSSQGMLLENCMLQNARTFLLSAGCNEYIPIDGSRVVTFKDHTGKTQTTTLDEYLAATGNDALNSYLLGRYSDPVVMQAALQSIQGALNDSGKLDYGGTIEVKDSLFYRSGISSIAMESFFNGPYLYTSAPSLISMLFTMVKDEETERPLVPLVPTAVSGISYPVHMNISGSTKFYDYKSEEDLDLTGLLSENISAVLQEFLKAMDQEQEVTMTIDDIFPLKSMLYQTAAKNGNAYAKDGETYLNIPVAFYGGGMNLSKVTFEGFDDVSAHGEEMSVDWVRHYLNAPPVSMDFSPEMMNAVMQKTVTIVTGFEPFRFVCTKGNGYLFGEAPSVSELRANFKNNRR